MTHADIAAAFQHAQYGVSAIQRIGDHYHVTVTRLRAPKAIDRHTHFAGTGLQLLRWGTDDRQRDWVFVVREKEE